MLVDVTRTRTIDGDDDGLIGRDDVIDGIKVVDGGYVGCFRAKKVGNVKRGVIGRF